MGFIRANTVGIILNTTVLGSQFLTFYSAVGSASVSQSAQFGERKPNPNSLIWKGVETILLNISQFRPKEKGKGKNCHFGFFF